MSQPHTSQTNKLLGYSDDARLLIINADDFGMCHAINAAILQSLRAGVVRSTSLMVPCPWAWEAMRLLAENPDIPFAVHLTVICEASSYKWGPVASRDRVPSLVGPTGHFYNIERIPAFLQQARLDELEVEFRAQIETVLDAKLRPTHLDWHCLRDGGRADIFDLTVALAQEYGLAVRAYDREWTQRVRQLGLPVNDYPLVDSYSIDPAGKSARYAEMLRDLPTGLSEWAVHPGLGHPELQALEPDSWQVRQTDFDFVMSPEAQAIIEQEGIVLLDYRPLQAVWQGQRS